MGKNKPETVPKAIIDFDVNVKVNQPETTKIEYGPRDTIHAGFNLTIPAFCLNAETKEEILDRAATELRSLLDRMVERT